VSPQELVQHILIVDDSPTIRRMVKTSLQALPGTPTFAEAASGLEAIEQLALGAVNLMVLDLNMPDIHGLEVLAFIRAHQKHRDMPVIVLTTRSEEDTRAAAFEAGATDFMTKPFIPRDLAARVTALLPDESRSDE
jgi:two-component system chemotaxis response regulator CheY